MDPDTLPPASSSNAARQKRSRRNDTHPIRWQDAGLEQAYNQDRAGRASATDLRMLHLKDSPEQRSGDEDS